MACERINENMQNCNCTYSGCSKHGKCCQCLQYHLANDELPACCFPPEVEKTYDRSFAAFVRYHTK